MRLEFESNVSALPVSEAAAQDEQGESVSGKAKELLHEGIKAAQSGNRSQARHLLLSVTEADPANENAWLWLASISEYPEELLVFLKNVLDINPDNQRAIQWTKATKSLLAKTFVQRGIEATKEDQKEFANQCFNQAIAQDEENEMAWLWMASVSDSDDEKLAFLAKVLTINAENEDAKREIAAVWERFSERHLDAAYAAAAQGDGETAHRNLDLLLEKLPETAEAWLLKSDLAQDPAEKAALLEKVLSIDPENEEAVSAIEAIRQDSVKKKLQAANVAAIEGNRESAVRLLGEVLSAAPEMEEAWVLRSHLAENFDEKIRAFEKVLELNPENLAARAGLDSLKAIMQSVAPNVVEESVEEGAEAAHEETVETVHEEIVEEAREETAEAVHEETWAAAEERAEAHFEEGEDRNPTQELELPAGFSENSPFDNEPVPENESYSQFDSAEGALPDDYAFSEDPWPTEDDLEEVAETVEELYPLAPEVNNHAPEARLAEEGKPAARFDENSEADEGRVSSEELQAAIVAESDDSGFSEDTGVIDFPEVAAECESSYGEAESPSEEARPEVADPSAETIEFSVSEAFAFEHNDDDPVSDYEEVNHDDPVSDYEEAAEGHGEPFEFARAHAEVFDCPFCQSENEPQAYVCNSCSAMLTLSDLEMLLAHPGADRNVLAFAIERMENLRSTPLFGEQQLRDLGIAHINLKNFEQGFAYLQEAGRINPNDVVLGGQVNALSIRLAEIREQAQAHESMVKGKTILVVDDSATVRKLIAGKLEKSGHEVICAVDGVDALEKIEDIVPDLILLDINMPRMDGYQVCKLIRNNHATENVPVVMISGKDGFFDKVRGRMSGTTGYITKPFGPETLMKALETYIINDTVHETIEE